MKATILIVDDNLTNMKLAADVLESDGCKVERAADAEEAQQILQRLHPDLILMASRFPGWTVCRLPESSSSMFVCRIFRLSR
jgi:two-component system cell cycle response regulator DivK